ncbi:6,7-dimethyl-8-ribityllumazine synthase [Ruania alkalisoli]|uniref:6,7-dimethyl-8-ribityllumazine synthase n=1 Tax=Ruania alkalisoli TaxID=2779775 RepID=A0A7M1SUG5_9MICO|nr:6,7-dimethyl-8-ribityllumazine synthase [Ruania alkalisoli]QOR71229.1 6,7-dimethyl-8-ribityllumazine synthase [Ruania alkalisoli]
MSTHAPHTGPQIQVPHVPHLRVAVVAARWHEEITTGLLDGALRALADAGIEEPQVVRVPGSFELPVAAGRLARGGFDAVVALGMVLQGTTAHFEYVCHGVTAGLTQVATSTGVPVGFGVLTCSDEAQARDRAGLPGSRQDVGYEATVAAISTAVALAGAGV